MYEINFEKRGVYCRYNGDVDLKDILEVVESILRHPYFDNCKYLLHDFTGIRSFNFDQDRLTLLAAQSLGSQYPNKNVRRAVITTSEEVLCMLSQFRELTMLDVKAFNTLDEARDWVSASTG